MGGCYAGEVVLASGVCAKAQEVQICPKTFIHDFIVGPQQSSSINCFATFGKCVRVRFVHFFILHAVKAVTFNTCFMFISSQASGGHLELYDENGTTWRAGIAGCNWKILESSAA